MKNILLPCLLLAATLTHAQTYQLTVENGYAQTGGVSAGDTIHIWAEEWGIARTFSHWSGDTAFLEAPNEWHTRVIMPPKDITVQAHTRILPTGTASYFEFEQIQGKNWLKPVYSYFPANGAPKAVVWLWHGSGGSAQNWVLKDLEMRQFCNYLVANDVAIIVSESDESTANVDLNGDGHFRYNYTPDTLNNEDLVNVRIIRDTFIARGKMTWKTSQTALGFSAGGAFSILSAAALDWKAAVSHNTPGPTNLPFIDIPVLYSMSQRDNHPDVGSAGNLEAYHNFQFLDSLGQCARFFLQRPSPTYPQRFKRLPGVTTAQSYSIHNELNANGCFGAGGYMTKSPAEIENLILNNPQNWPVILALAPQLQEYVKDELAVMWSAHHFHPDFMAADLNFLLNACSSPSVGVETPEDAAALKIFPNPSSGWITLPENSGWVRIFDLNGKPVLEKHLRGSSSVDVSMLPAGLYFLQTERGWSKFVRN